MMRKWESAVEQQIVDGMRERAVRAVRPRLSPQLAALVLDVARTETGEIVAQAVIEAVVRGTRDLQPSLRARLRRMQRRTRLRGREGKADRRRRPQQQRVGAAVLGFGDDDGA